MMKIDNRYNFGILAEKIAILFLFLKGYKILAWRWKSRFGEIDIIGKKGNKIIAFEVKARSFEFLAEEVLKPKQIARIKNSLEFFIAKNPKYQKYDLRLDFIAFNKFLIPKHYINFIS